MSKLALIALLFAGRGGAADRTADQVATGIKSKAVEALVWARAAGRSRPEKADDRRDVSTQASAAATTLPRLQRAVSGEKFCEQSGFSEDECKSYNSAACETCDTKGACAAGASSDSDAARGGPEPALLVAAAAAVAAATF